MKANAVILIVLTAIAFACAKPAPSSTPKNEFKDPMVLITEYTKQHGSSGPDYRKFVLDLYSGLLSESRWELLTGPNDKYYSPDKVYTKVGIAREIESYQDYKKLLTHLGITELAVPEGARYAGITIHQNNKLLESYTVAEQRTLLVGYQGEIHKLGKWYIPYSPLMLIPMMAKSGRPEFNSINEIVEAKFGEELFDNALEDLQKISEKLKERERSIVEFDSAVKQYMRLRSVAEKGGSRLDWEALKYAAEEMKSIEIPDFEDWFCRNYMPEYANWVAGGLFEPWHEEFSPGNGLIRQITDTTEVAGLLKAVTEGAKKNSDNYILLMLQGSPEKFTFYAYRLYGESDLILEGVAWYLPDIVGWTGVMKRAKETTTPILINKLKTNSVDSKVLRQIEMFAIDRVEPAYFEEDSWPDVNAERKTAFDAAELKEIRHAQEGSVLGAEDVYATLGLASGRKIKQWNLLTRNEKRALYSLSVVSAEHRIRTMLEYGYSSISSIENLAEMISAEFRDSTLIQETDPRFIDAGYDELFDTWLSPVTGHTFEPWHKEWSKGNGYIIQITDKKAIASLKKLYEKELESNDLPYRYERDDYKSEPSRLQFYYSRLYGEEVGSIIAEGIWYVWRTKVFAG